MSKDIRYNGEFSKIDTPEKAYVLGLIYSDGCVGKYKTRYFHTIVLDEKDIDLLKTIQEKFPFYNLKRHTKTSFKLSCSEKSCVIDLQKNGVLERKSTDNKDKLHLPNIDVELYHHFIRGFFDGDGSVYTQKIGNTKIEIGGTCFYLITDIIKILYDNRITVNMRCKYIGKALRKHDFYILFTSSDKVSKQFADYIYKDCGELYMKRKYNKLYYIPEYHIKERIICPICGSNNTTYNGIRQMKTYSSQRCYCKNCTKRFSIKLAAPLSSNIQSGEGELLEG